MASPSSGRDHFIKVIQDQGSSKRRRWSLLRTEFFLKANSDQPLDRYTSSHVLAYLQEVSGAGYPTKISSTASLWERLGRFLRKWYSPPDMLDLFVYKGLRPG